MEDSPGANFAEREIGSSGWTRTSNPPVNRLTRVQHLVDSSVVQLPPNTS